MLRHYGVASIKGLSAGHKVSLSPHVQVGPSAGAVGPSPRPGTPNRGAEKAPRAGCAGPALLWLLERRPRAQGCFCSAAAEEACRAARGRGQPPSRSLWLLGRAY